MRLLPRALTSDEKARGVRGKGREIPEHVAPPRQVRVRNMELLGARDERLQPPPHQGEIVVCVRYGSQLGRVRLRQMVPSVRTALHITEIIVDGAAQ